MRLATVGLAALLAGVPMAGALAETLQDEIQDEEQPGSVFEMDIGRGQVEIGRQRNLRPPVQIEDQSLDVPNDPDDPEADDPVDADLPGEGPEDLSGPDDDDSLPE